MNSIKGIRGLAVAVALLLAAFAPSIGWASPGGSEAEPTPYIVGGEEATAEQFPWQAQITIDGIGEWCGGTLIHPRIVLTAAHCVWDSQIGWFPARANMRVHMGRTRTNAGGSELEFSAMRKAPNYDEETGANDWAIILLTTATSRPVAKIAGPDERGAWSAGKPAIVTGYGAQSEESESSSPTLRKLTVPILDDTTCAGPNSYGSAFIASSMLCAGFIEGGRDSCSGDSGGPLVVPVDGDVRLVGVVSWGAGCAHSNYPGIYTRVAEPPLSSMIASFVLTLEAEKNFPMADRGISPVGSGAKPEGCGAASGVATAEAEKASKAAAAAGRAKAALAKARKRQRKAKGKAKRAARRSVKRAGERSRLATRKSAEAKEKSRAAASDAASICTW